MPQKPIYLDYNATTPIDPLVAEAMLPYLYSRFGNPSSSHAFGAEAKEAVEQARRQIAKMLGCLPEEIIFTSSGTESNNMALKGTAMEESERGNHLITSSIEHPAILEVCAHLEKMGFRVTYVSVDEYGRVEPAAVEKAITEETFLISIMHANNEVGTIQPIKEIAEIAHSHSINIHTDAAQSIGKIRVDVNALGVDLLSVAGHKFYAPKGIGALFIRSGIQLTKQIHGANHERNLRAGTENVLEIAGLGKACELAAAGLDDHAAHMREMRNAFEQGILERIPWAKINGHPVHRLPNTSSISFKNLEANKILAELSGVAASAGAACHAERVDVSHVLKAMQLPKEYAMGTLRFSVGRMTTHEEILQAVREIEKVVKRLALV
jgi:cysteine desulfurase NifS